MNLQKILFLANNWCNFGTNADAPYYFTPVFFKKEVLQKYILKPELYTITDGSLQCQVLWQLQIDNHHKDCVIAYLGDLGKIFQRVSGSIGKAIILTAMKS